MSEATLLGSASGGEALERGASIDVKAIRAMADRVAAGGLREAFQAAIIGNEVVRGVTRHWQRHDGMCLCGLELETVEHIWWRCPRY